VRVVSIHKATPAVTSVLCSSKQPETRSVHRTKETTYRAVYFHLESSNSNDGQTSSSSDSTPSSLWMCKLQYDSHSHTLYNPTGSLCYGSPHGPILAIYWRKPI